MKFIRNSSWAFGLFLMSASFAFGGGQAGNGGDAVVIYKEAQIQQLPQGFELYRAGFQRSKLERYLILLVGREAAKDFVSGLSDDDVDRVYRGFNLDRLFLLAPKHSVVSQQEKIEKELGIIKYSKPNVDPSHGAFFDTQKAKLFFNMIQEKLQNRLEELPNPDYVAVKKLEDLAKRAIDQGKYRQARTILNYLIEQEEESQEK